MKIAVIFATVMVAGSAATSGLTNWYCDGIPAHNGNGYTDGDSLCETVNGIKDGNGGCCLGRAPRRHAPSSPLYQYILKCLSTAYQYSDDNDPSQLKLKWGKPKRGDHNHCK
jgi:hypothetical protein